MGNLAHQVRAEIRDGTLRGAPLRSRLEAHAYGRRKAPHRRGYDELDSFVSALLLDGTAPPARRALEPNMVQYQPTPARIVFALLEQARVADDDVFVDVGSGLGQVPMLANLLTGAAAIGIELEPAYCEYAQRCAADLNLENVTYWNGDARAADYAGGTVFFLYTPVTGAMLQAVLERIRSATSNRTIKVLTYGPCTEAIATLPWLMSMGSIATDPESAGLFVADHHG